MLSAVLFSIAAPCGLISFILSVTNEKGVGLIILLLVTAGLTTFSAVTNWVVYFKKYVDYKIESKLSEKKE